ncbi:MAG: hypothetical protein ACFFEY_11295 [Candidatus Thorarchaeota archaeon]
MKKQTASRILIGMLFLIGISGIMIPVSAQVPTTVYITFDVEFTVYTPQGNILAYIPSMVVEQPFLKTGSGYHTDRMWHLIPWLYPEDITGSPVIISQGQFHCWMSFMSHWPEPPLPLVQEFWGYLTIIDDQTMLGNYFDRGYVISEEFPGDFHIPGLMIPVQIGNTDIWYLGYTVYTVSPVYQ